jgi:hypothetical protein
MATRENSDSEPLTIRAVEEEFKAFVQHKIEVLERFKNVGELKVYLDALELGLRTIQELQMEERAEMELTEVEFQAAPEVLPEPPAGVDEEPDMETEELDDSAGEAEDEEWALANDGEVLVGEGEEAEKAAEAGPETEITAPGEAVFEEEGSEGEGDHDTAEEAAGGEVEPDTAEDDRELREKDGEHGVLTRRWMAESGEGEGEGESVEEGPGAVEEEVEEGGEEEGQEEE